MENLKLIIEEVLSNIEFPVVYGTAKFWEEVDKMILKEIRDGNYI